ncbi:MAG: thioredoxin domain-containing protein [Proteobacteria bacterium]|nr:thioredoxin domain-containing protein [Pseudomonadota bacterium]
MRINFSQCALVILSTIFLAGNSRVSFAQSLYNAGGKNVEIKDLSPSQQQQIFDIQFEAYEKTRMTVENMIFENHVDQEAKKQNKKPDEVVQKILDVKNPSDKDIKKWYEENKTKIPPNLKFDDIKDKIGEVVKQEKMKSKRDELLEKLKKEQKFTFAMTKPVAPVIDVKIDGFQSKGKADAKVTIVEFADYQCPHCKHAAEAFKKVTDKYKDKVKFVYIDFPINPSGISKLVAEASYCAAEQGKFWEFHYKAFESQATLDKDSSAKLAKDLKMDEGKFKACVDGGATKATVEKGRAEGERIGISGTPYILINGRKYAGAHTVEAITAEVQEALK